MIYVQLDTNILARLAQPSHPLHATAFAALQTLQAAGHVPCIVFQNLFEFWVVATRPLDNNGLGLSVTEAKAEMEKLKKAFVLLIDVPPLLDQWERLIVAHDCKGKLAHDARIVAAMIVHEIDHLLTFNVKDFTRYTSITVLDAGSPRGVPSPITPS